jgi:uncharacterized metal-binding protein
LEVGIEREMTGREKKKVIVVPCSGIGKALGTVAREAAYEVLEEMRPQTTDVVALALLVLGDEETRSVVRANPCLTIDGCKLACASKNVTGAGGWLAGEFNTIDALRKHRGLKPEGVIELNEDGQQLARRLAEEVAAAADELIEDQEEIEDA